jgi:hypothetical protein
VMKEVMKSVAVGLSICLIANATQISTTQKQKVEAFYVPFGVETYIATTSTSIETRHNISSLISGKTSRFKEILMGGSPTSFFDGEYVRLKLKVEGETYLVDSGYHVLLPDGSQRALNPEQKEALYLLFLECIPTVSNPND